MKTTLIGLFLLLTACGVKASDPVTLNVNSTESQFVVTLAANPSTGYQWQVVKYDTQLLSLTNSQFKASQTQRVGAPGEMRFTFSLIQGQQRPEKTDILLKYARAWESEQGTHQTVTVYFKP